MNVQKDFEEFFELLNREKAKYLIVGAHAVGFHGMPRLTADIDVFVEPGVSNAPRVTKAVRSFGFNINGIQQEDFMRPDAIMQLGYPPVRIDIITSISGVSFRQAWKNRVRGKYGRIDVWYISKKDLIANKRASGRKKDEVDLEFLTRRVKRR